MCSERGRLKYNYAFWEPFENSKNQTSTKFLYIYHAILNVEEES